MARYKFYREHKFVSAAVNDIERLIARADFRDKSQVDVVKQAFDGLVRMLKGHAYYEDTVLHELLKKKNSAVYKEIEETHHVYDQQIADLEKLLKKAMDAQGDEEQVEAGYQFYLWFRKFAGDNLLHLHEEETVILPELHRLYSDDELGKVEFATYQQMTAEDMAHMCLVLFPHMNPSDRLVFLSDLKTCQPEKFAVAWKEMGKAFPEEEFKLVSLSLGI